MVPKHQRIGQSIRWTVADWILLGMVSLVAAFALLQLMLMGFGRDQGIYAVVANSVLRGEMPYRDAWDFKPPGIFVIYTVAQAIFGANEWGIRLIEVISFASLVPLMGVFARRFFGDVRMGWVAGALAIWIQAQLEFWHTAQPESFGGVLAIAAMVICTHPVKLEGPGARWKPWVRWFAAGLFFGAAGLMKPHLLGVPVVAAGHAAWRLRLLGIPWKRQLGSFVAVGMGSVTTLALCLLWFFLRGALSDLHHTLFIFAPGYAATTWEPQFFFYYTYSALHGAAMGFSAIAGVGIVLSIGAKHRFSREKEGLWLIAAAAFPQILGIAIQSKFFPYHYGSVLPFCSLLAAPGLWKLWLYTQRLPVFGPTLFVLGLLAASHARTATRDLSQTFVDRSWERTTAFVSGDSTRREQIDAHLYTVADVDYGANLQVARWIANHTSPQDTVYIWGFEPHIYFAANRRSASKFIYNVAQRVAWENQGSRDELIRELSTDPPRVLVVERGDVFPIVTGNNQDSASALREFPALERFIRERYVFGKSIQDFDLYVYRSSS